MVSSSTRHDGIQVPTDSSPFLSRSFHLCLQWKGHLASSAGTNIVHREVLFTTATSPQRQHRHAAVLLATRRHRLVTVQEGPGEAWRGSRSEPPLPDSGMTAKAAPRQICISEKGEKESLCGGSRLLGFKISLKFSVNTKWRDLLIPAI